jgi:hypothetical protein
MACLSLGGAGVAEGLEPAASGVTGRRANQLGYRSPQRNASYVVQTLVSSRQSGANEKGNGSDSATLITHGFLSALFHAFSQNRTRHGSELKHGRAALLIKCA